MAALGIHAFAALVHPCTSMVVLRFCLELKTCAILMWTPGVTFISHNIKSSELNLKANQLADNLIQESHIKPDTLVV
ncbi:MAG: hypothetical protein HRT38_05375 [Alteromonadaceae bacterium]|nr:hypothetical protein [Alteromonadaceae bacterium]